MSLFDRMLNWLAGRQPQQEQPKRGFQGAVVNRLTNSWTTSNTAINADLNSDLPKLRARSRDLAQNNEYGKRFLQMVTTHVVGPSGFTLQSQVKLTNGAPDERANEAIEQAFAEWAQKGVCDVTKKLSFVEIQRLAIAAAARDGEFLIQKHRGTDFNKFGFALQIIDIDRLDHSYSGRLGNGNTVSMGVELDSFGAPVAYYILEQHPGSSYSANVTGRRLRVPAEDIYHCFVSDRPEQVRGYPWMHASMTRLQNLDGYEEAAVIAARVGASKMGFFRSSDSNLGPLATEQVDGEFYQDAEPGEFGVLPPGYDFVQWNPDYPHQNYDGFVKAALRGIASGFGVAYHTLASDLEGVNYSSARAGSLEERDNWVVIQNWMIESFLIPLFKDWMQMALMKGAVILTSGNPLPLSKIDQFLKFHWQGRRWQWVDPQKDLAANIMAIQAGLKSRSQVAAEQGVDLSDVWAQLQREEQQAAKLGLKLNANDQGGSSEEEEKESAND